MNTSNITPQRTAGPTSTSYFAVVPKGLTNPCKSSSSTTSSDEPSTAAAVGPSSAESRRFLRLPHPRSGEPGLYLVHDEDDDEDEDDHTPGNSTPHAESTPETPQQRHSSRLKKRQTILEIQSVDPLRKRSWFYGDEVVSDGSLLILTPINPRYLIIPLLLAHALTSSSSGSSVGSIASGSSSKPGVSGSGSTSGSTRGSGSITDLLDRERSAKRTDNFLPLDDLVDSLGRVGRCRLVEPFARAGGSVVGVGGRARRGRAVGQDEVDDDDEDVEMDGMDGLMRGQEGRGDGWDGNQDVVEFLGVPVVNIALQGLCEGQTIASETYYRPSLLNILDFLRKKLDDLSQEETFDAQPSLKRGLVGLGLGHLLTEKVRHSTKDGGDGVEVDVEVKVEVKRGTGEEEQEEVLKLARVRLAGEVLGQYLEPRMKAALMGSYDFDPLDKYLETQDSLMNAASRPITQSSGLEAFWDDTDPNAAKKKEAAAAALKRKGSEKGSRAQESLKKVNTSKMPKLTTFFKKKTA